ncbi:hypothetical protein OG874_00760 [Nocardia sp. NBC_00565]|nr:hypothetical protein [Nocardia sp. NBC_00565]WUC03787.1 hypothetical protein OG874_00760 [Nocardia sp. NBC_00565]
MSFMEFADLPLDKVAELGDSPLVEARLEDDTPPDRMRFTSMHP